MLKRIDQDGQLYSLYPNVTVTFGYKKNSSADEIANVNFPYDDIVHALQNTIDSCINSATDRRGYVLERRFTKFSEITQCNVHYEISGGVQCHLQKIQVMFMHIVCNNKI